MKKRKKKTLIKKKKINFLLVIVFLVFLFSAGFILIAQKNNKVEIAGNPTIGVGHYMTNAQADKNKFTKLFGKNVTYADVYKARSCLTEQQVKTLFLNDINEKLKVSRRIFYSFDNYPDYMQCGLLNGVYRGDIKSTHKTVKDHLNPGQKLVMKDKNYIEGAKNLEVLL